MYKTLKARIVGIAPLIMHSGQTADPLNRYAKAIKEISGKRKKTEADYEKMAEIEFKAGLYMGADGPVIPAVMIEATLLVGARKSKNGRLAQAGIIVEKHARLEYDGPRTADALFAKEDFRRSDPVRVGTAKVMRTRPWFQKWSAEIEVLYLADVINERDLIAALKDAGAYAGFGDWRPRYGRFALAADLSAQMPVAA
jgi:hypothetical protein